MYRYYNYAFNPAASNTTIDSGTVQYTVLGSSIENDSTVVWVARESSALTYCVWPEYSNTPDTIYTVDDSTIVQVTEKTYGMHELNANGLVWQFPIGYPGIRVFRYAPVPRVDSTLQYWNNGVTFNSNVSLSDSAGMYYWSTTSSGGGHSSPVYITTAQLKAIPVTAVESREPPSETFLLEQNYPDPFNPTTVVSYQLPTKAVASLKVVDVLGREVGVLVNQQQSAGTHSVTFNASNLPSGLYFYSLQGGAY